MPSSSTGWAGPRWLRAISIWRKEPSSGGNLNPSRLDAEEELARIAGQRGDMDLLADVADKTIAAAPRFPGGYVWRAMVEMSHNSADKAEADLKTAIGVAPQRPAGLSPTGQDSFRAEAFSGRSRTAGAGIAV